MIKTEDMILINDHNEDLLRVVRYNEFCRTAVGARELSLKLEENKTKQNKTQKQSYEKEHNKQLHFHRAGVILMTRISFHPKCTWKP